MERKKGVWTNQNLQACWWSFCLSVRQLSGVSSGFELCRKWREGEKQRQKHKEKERKALTWPGVKQVHGARTLRRASDTQRGQMRVPQWVWLLYLRGRLLGLCVRAVPRDLLLIHRTQNLELFPTCPCEGCAPFLALHDEFSLWQREEASSWATRTSTGSHRVLQHLWNHGGVSTGAAMLRATTVCSMARGEAPSVWSWLLRGQLGLLKDSSRPHPTSSDSLRIRILKHAGALSQNFRDWTSGI